jgi:hypothetical protein
MPENETEQVEPPDSDTEESAECDARVIAEQTVAAPEAPKYTRSADRVPWNSRVEVVWLHRFDEGPIVYQASDISEMGVAIVTPGMVHTGMRGIVLVQSRSGKRALRGFEVAHCRYESEIRAHVTGGKWIALPDGHDRLTVEEDDGVWRIKANLKRKSA